MGGSSSRAYAAKEADASGSVPGAMASSPAAAASAAEFASNISRLSIYAASSDAALQREVAERFANVAVSAEGQRMIVEAGGLALLVPLARSPAPDVRRLAAHSLANLSVLPDNQDRLATPDVIAILLELLCDGLAPLGGGAGAGAGAGAAGAGAGAGAPAGGATPGAAAAAAAPLSAPGSTAAAAPSASPASPGGIPPGTASEAAKQAAKCVANLAVKPAHKRAFGQGGFPFLAPLARLASAREPLGVRVEAIAAIANLAVDDANERPIGAVLLPTLVDVIRAGRDDELTAQAARALRNLSVHAENQAELRALGGVPALAALTAGRVSERVRSQAAKALANLGEAPLPAAAALAPAPAPLPSLSPPPQ